MRTLCERCKKGPAGVQGHAHLLALVLGDDWMAFNCDGCHALWSRTTRPNRFTWARLPKRQRLHGVHIPRRYDAPV